MLVGNYVLFTNGAKFGQSENILISGKKLTDDDEVMLMTCLREMTLKQIKLLAKK